METADLRIALFSGNYNYVRDGANQALNRLVDYLLRQGAQVRIYAPVVAEPAFEATGDLVGVGSLPIPGRAEYRVPLRVVGKALRNLEAFAANVVHVSSPDPVGHQAVTWARKHGLPVLASVHTRFETYMRYYNMAWGEPVMEALLRRFYRRCDALVAPSESMAQVLRDQRMNYDISIWSRGVDRKISAFVGFLQGSDLGRAVASMDVLFNPSVTETFGNVTLEVMACGLPVVAAAATGSQSLVDDRNSGRLIPPGAIHQFAEALRAYIEDPALRTAHGRAGEARASEFSWDKINQAVADTYIRLIRQKTRR
ncbi:MAG: glycosyltransferase [Novosphingobium sp.]